MRSPGWRVHGWMYPVVWWARRKPRSNIRQFTWDLVDALNWHLVVKRKIRKGK